MVKITEQGMEKFFRDEIIYRLGLPRVLLIDNGKQFDNPRFRRFCAQYHIDFRNTSVGRPNTNAQVEVTNRVLLEGIKRRLDQLRGE